MDISASLTAMAYRKVVIYYFSGTGNSCKVAEWFSLVATENGIGSEIISIAKTGKKLVEPPEEGALVVFISPIHGFNYPPIMLRFLMRFPKGKNRIVLMNTRAGMLIGKFITPGLTGIAFFLSSLILFLKGYSIKAILPVDMPSNWISVHPGLNTHTVKYLHERNKERVEVFARKILQGKSCFKALIEVYDILLAPIALGYFLVGRFFFAKSYYASRDCDDCGLCIKECPVHAIIKVDNRLFWTLNCESCMKCMSNCPKKAIETGHGFIAVFVYAFSTFLLVGFYKYFNAHIFPIENAPLKMVVESALFIALLIVWYRLVHWMLRFRLAERIIVFTSLTKYKWWGRRYKALKNHGQSCKSGSR
jgi:Pyruvate/2-oxoacid:ferredoxin oxidoreductase delta subunit